jgi:hypothetical protein
MSLFAALFQVAPQRNALLNRVLTQKKGEKKKKAAHNGHRAPWREMDCNSNFLRTPFSLSGKSESKSPGGGGGADEREPLLLLTVCVHHKKTIQIESKQSKKTPNSASVAVCARFFPSKLTLVR